MRNRSVKTLVLMGVLTAVSIVLSRFLGFYLNETLRISFGSVPILLAGLWLGPVAGGLVGGVADILGAAVFSGLGLYPPITVGPILIGVTAGLIGRATSRPTLLKCALAVILAEVAGSVLWTSFALSMMVGKGFAALLVARLPANLIMMVLDTVIVFTLDKRLFCQCNTRLPQRSLAIADKGAMHYLAKLQKRGSKPGLSRMETLLKELGHPEQELSFVHIAGTNGKGSTAAMLASILRASGYKTGLYTSPAIDGFRERIQINGTPIDSKAAAAQLALVRPIAEAMEDLPTEFEVVTAAALCYFASSRCDIVALETGMGGKNDATNVIPAPEVAILTHIGLDHTRELGDTLAKIATQKAGIIKHGCQVVSYGQMPEADAVIAETAQRLDCPLHVADFSRITDASVSVAGIQFSFGSWQSLFCPLTGSYQLKNAAVALTAVEALRTVGWNIGDSAVFDGLAETVWHGRFELLRAADPVFVTDGGHNPAGVAVTAESIQTCFPGQKPVFLMGVMADKDVDGILDLLTPLSDRFVTVRPDNPRAMSPTKLANKLRQRGVHATAKMSIRSGIRLAMRLAGTGGLVVAVGTLYMQGDIRAYFAKHSTKRR